MNPESISIQEYFNYVVMKVKSSDNYKEEASQLNGLLAFDYYEYKGISVKVADGGCTVVLSADGLYAIQTASGIKFEVGNKDFLKGLAFGLGFTNTRVDVAIDVFGKDGKLVGSGKATVTGEPDSNDWLNEIIDTQTVFSDNSWLTKEYQIVVRDYEGNSTKDNTRLLNSSDFVNASGNVKFKD